MTAARAAVAAFALVLPACASIPPHQFVLPSCVLFCFAETHLTTDNANGVDHTKKGAAR